MSSLDYHQSNVDRNEVQKFSAMANDWWRLDGPCEPLHIINPIRLQFIKQHCDLRGARVLDLGCGAGILSESLALNDAHVTGLDASSEMIIVAHQHAEQKKLQIDYRAIYSHDFLQQQPEPFDVITCMELLEHVPDPAAILQDCFKLLKPGGKIFLSTINRNPKSYMLAIIAAEYLLRLLPKHTHDYSKFIRPSELAEILRTSGFSVQELAGLHYQPFTKSARLTTDVSVNYMALAVKNYGSII